MTTAVAPQLVERNLTESSDIQGKVSQGVIEGVKLLGFTSKNGRRYSEQALKKALDSKFYEGATIYVDHPDKGNRARSYRDRFARVESVQYRIGEGLFGNMRFNPHHPMASQVVWDAEHKTEGVGLSHNIIAKTRSDKSGEIIEEITKVHSVDLVDNPATTRSLFESAGECDCEECPMKKNKDGQEKKTVAQSLEQFMEQFPEPARKLLTEMATDPVMSAGMPGAPASSPEDAIKSGMRTAVMAAFDDPSLDSAETLDKIRALLAALDAALGKSPQQDAGAKVAAELPPPKTPEGAPGEQEPEGDEGQKPDLPPDADKDEEQKKKFEQTERRLMAMECLARNQIKPAETLVKELTEQTTRPAMEALVKTWSAAKRGEAKPTIRTALMEATGVEKYPATYDDFKAALKR